ncbi:sterol 24-C-methyltransferase-3 [Coleophoma cylindrospora]|uniref:Sterol 24-C-methyltransferase-3 n=1 Tax=Coleophoma cylindrospora TaxID=1849047 RepID=A0A3D8RNA1_9HELO|nr:sterol 24-C-methyltransferase-3 [Coleophoma cylindrospora]
MAPKLHLEDHNKDASFNKVLHSNSSRARGGMLSMLAKNKEAQKLTIDEYFEHWGDGSAVVESEEVRQSRRDEYANLTQQYYNLVTDLYEYGWGTSFHFCRFAYGEGFYQAIARHEHYLAHRIGLREGMKVLDVGCGIGGPAREMIKFTGVDVVGLNNNDYQIERGINYAAREGLSAKLSFVKADFMQMPFQENSFDAIYSIEATVHAPSLQGVYHEIYKALKPGGVFGVYEWFMTDKYDNDNVQQRQLRFEIEEGDGISNMVTVSEGLQAIKDAGFELLYHEDMAQREDVKPWYYPLAGDIKHASSLADLFTMLRLTKAGRSFAHLGFGIGERIGLIPPGTQKIADTLAKAQDAMVIAAKANLFTPMYLMVARKPLLE